MKAFLLLILLFSSTLCAFGNSNQAKHYSPDYITKSYFIYITHSCPEGCVSCDNIKLRCTNRATGKTVELTGNTLHTLAADGVTPARFLGYQFVDGTTVYMLLEFGNFTITKNKKNIVKEKTRFVTK
jgi:hypothetical protein